MTKRTPSAVAVVQLLRRGAARTNPFVSTARCLVSDGKKSDTSANNTTAKKTDGDTAAAKKPSDEAAVQHNLETESVSQVEAPEARKDSLSPHRDKSKDVNTTTSSAEDEHKLSGSNDKTSNLDAASEKSIKYDNADASGSSMTSSLEQMQRILQDTSGLTELQQLKSAVEEASAQFDKATQRVAECRKEVEEAQKAHELAHKKHVNLLMRREDWSGDDAQSFVNITSEEVTTRQDLLQAQTALKRAEDHAIATQHAYMDAMRKRYHEEQLWQDKWRLLGTYGTWSLIGINTMVFIGGQIVTQRREMNRLKRMEQLLIQHQEENRKIYETSAGTIAAANGNVVASAMAEDDTKVATATDNTEETTGGTEPGATIAPPSDDASHLEVLRYKLAQSLRHIPPLHTPSMALGAGVSASACIVVLSLMSSRR